MRSTLFAVLASLGAVACGPPIQHMHGTLVHEETAGSSKGGKGDVSCNNVADTGTLVAHSECHPVTRDQDAHDDSVRSLSRSTAAPTKGK